MARTVAPLFGFDASGKIGGALVFSKWKGRPYVRRLVTPRNPKSPKQISVRAMMTFLSQQWKNLTSTEQDTWNVRGDQLIVSPFNAYTKVNQSRWGNFDAPGKTDPVGSTGTPGVVSVFAGTGGVLQATIDFQLGTLNDNWGILLYRSTTGAFTPSFSNMIAAVRLEDLNLTSFVDTPLAAGTFFYNAQVFTDDGLKGTLEGEISVTVNPS